MRRILLLFVLSALSVVVGCTASNDKKKLTIAVIPKGTTHEFWKSIHAGSNKAAAELKAQGTDVEVIWKGPLPIWFAASCHQVLPPLPISSCLAG